MVSGGGGMEIETAGKLGKSREYEVECDADGSDSLELTC